MATRHFLSLLDFSPTELQTVIQRAIELKKKPINQNFNGKVLSMVFEKASTRTRISFEAGMAQMGGSAIFLSPRDTQLGRGEPIEDSARVISSMTDIVMIRTFAHETIETFAEYSSVPVINALTDALHPCQLLADMQTFYEQRGSIQGKKVTWVGDGNNMCQSYINAAKQFDFELSIACPKGFEPDAAMLTANSDRVTVLDDPQTAVANADLVVTDVWASMGQEDQQGELVFSRELSSTVQDMSGNILLCDDLSDTGVTLNRSIDWLKKYPPLKGKIKSIKTAVLWKKADSTFEPDFCAQRLKDNPWIVQPFEKYEEIRIEDLKKSQN